MANASDRITVINPQGQLGTIPKQKQQDAVGAGYMLRSDAVKVIDPKSGQAGYIPKANLDKAQSAGYILHPEEQAERELSGTIEKAWKEHQQRLMKLGEYESRASSSPTPFTTASLLYGAAAIPEAIGSGSPRELASAGLRALKGTAKASATAAAAGGGIGYAVGGTKGAETGAQIGATAGAGYGLLGGLNAPSSLEEEADLRVAKEMAYKAARVRAGIDPPAEDTIAEVLRQEFLSTPKKSSVPQEIGLPKPPTPTYVPEGVPGAPEVPPAPKTIGQIARERIATATRRAGDKAIQRTANIEEGVGPRPPKPGPPPPPEVSKLSEGPTALQHQAARDRALQDIRNATINREGWVSKLPDRVKFKKLPPAQQRSIIQRAIDSDAQASSAVRTGAREGSAGDLASWTPEQLWSQYMHKSSTPDLKQSIANELARRGQVKAFSNQVRP